ncbi:heme NO-binding domain-containing protein [Labilithrix luteola]|uniref:heme NO-binding domain-containing protein n=1 Tax=Labilithrix luteola TaxID=1391654 RepID=UPI0011BA80FF|nr:heme NO-binding domain-containing protein [Labilithrix luteola]
MKGTVITCLREIVINAGGEATWQACLSAADFEEFTVFHLAEDVPDHKALALIRAICAKLGLTLEQAGDAFGEHWVNVYGPRLYKHLYGKYANAREFFLNINEMHARVTKHLADSRPPRFRLEWMGPNTLVMHYESHRGLIDVAVGMARAMGRYYGERLVVTKLSSKALRIVFA